jgi:hypothetical protein
MRSLDPQGKRALFETPPSAAPDRMRAGPKSSGRTALFSTADRRTGTVIVECSDCGVRSRVGLPDLGVRFVTLSAFVPGRKHPHWLKCPACGHRRWCRIGWNE